MNKIDFFRDPEYQPAYTVSNEDIRWVVDAYPNAHDILTVAGSGDQAIFYAIRNTSNIDTFDITRMAGLIQDIKTTAIQRLSYDEYKQFLVDICRNRKNPNMGKIVETMPLESSWLLANPYIPCKFKTFISYTDPNLPTELEYERMQQSITQPFNFICTPLTELHKHITKKYDIINISNIFDNFYGDKLSTANEQKETILNLIPSLKLGGRILYIPQNYKYDLSKILNERVHGCRCEKPIQHPTERFTKIIPIQRTR